MIEVKTATEAAQKYLESIEELINARLVDIKLEEFELSDDASFWFITLGFERVVEPKKLLGLEFQWPSRDYKVFKVNAQTGIVEAMKIRCLDGATQSE